MSGQQYKDSIRDLKVNAYVMGKKIEKQLEHPLIAPAIEAVALTYDLALADKEDKLTVVSPLTGSRVNRFTHIYQKAGDLINRLNMMREYSRRHGMCAGARCVMGNIATGLHSVTYEMDQKNNTNYQERFLKYWERIQREDLAVAGYINDAKGDRSKRPGEQPDPDAYLRIVEEKRGGIVVRGAKVLISGGSIAHEALVIPTRELRPDEKAYAVAFAIPTGSPGITYLSHVPAPDFRRLVPEADGMDFGNPRYGVYNLFQCFFDDVFVPWERVFMKGETEFSGPLLDRISPTFRCVTGACKCGHRDLLIGGSAVMADYNGVGNAAHIQQKLTNMSYESELSYGCLLGAAHEGYTTPSGAYFPNSLYANVGKYQANMSLWHCARIGVDITGGLVMSMITSKDMADPTLGPLIDKYFRAKPEVSTENRLKMVRLMEYLTGIGSILVAESSVGGAPTASQELVIRTEVRKRLGEYKACALELAGIKD
jgi:4-hydroxybutyryl-CoA dehydratase/vinylacetyl-CoA-Delta-isomerase